MNPLVIAQAGLGVLQTGIGIVNSIGAKKRQNKLLSQRTAFQTPVEINEILQMRMQDASFGIDPDTMGFLSNKINSNLASSLDVIQRIGGDPNMMNSIYGHTQDAFGNLGEMTTEAKMKKFSAVIDAMNALAANKAAEWKSREDITKDKLQAAGADLNTANQNISGGLNSITGALAAEETMDLYGNGKTPKKTPALF